MKPIQIQEGIWIKVTVDNTAEYIDSVPAFITLSTSEDFLSGHLGMYNLKSHSIDDTIKMFKEEIKEYNESRTSSIHTTCSGHSRDRELSGLCCKNRKSERQSGETS